MRFSKSRQEVKEHVELVCALGAANGNGWFDDGFVYNRYDSRIDDRKVHFLIGQKFGEDDFSLRIRSWKASQGWRIALRQQTEFDWTFKTAKQ